MRLSARRTKFTFPHLRGCRSTDPALLDLRSDHSVRAPYVPPAIALPASLPIPSRNTLHVRAIPLSAAPEVEALPVRSGQRILVPAGPAPGHGLAAHIGRQRSRALYRHRVRSSWPLLSNSDPHSLNKELGSFDPYPQRGQPINGLLVLVSPLRSDDGSFPCSAAVAPDAAAAVSAQFIRRVRGGPRQRAGAGGSAMGVGPTAGGGRGRDR
jgi:hypothetical protein